VFDDGLTVESVTWLACRPRCSTRHPFSVWQAWRSGRWQTRPP